jgi:hypothetical protein
VTLVNAEQASKRTMRRPTRRPFRGRLTFPPNLILSLTTPVRDVPLARIEIHAYLASLDRTLTLTEARKRKDIYGSPVIQDSERFVICFSPISHQQIGQIIKDQPLAVLIHRSDQMILSVPAVMHDDEPHAVRRDSKLLSPRLLSEGISFAIAFSHCDRFERTDPLARRRLNHEIDGYV